MTTSGKYIVDATALDIIQESLGLIGVYAPGESLDDSEADDALRTLRFFLKARQHQIGIWLYRELSLFLADETVSYSIGPTGTHCAQNAIKTEVATAAASGASSLVIDSTTGFGDTFDRDGISEASTPTGAGSFTLGGALCTSGIATLSSNRKVCFYSDANESGDTYAITGTNAAGVAVTESVTGPNATTVYSTNEYKTITSITTTGAGTGNIEIGQVGDHVGIELDDGTVQWTNIGAALSTTLTLITTLTDSVAVDNHVYSYTTKTPRPIELVEARLVRPDGRETPLVISGRQDYQLLSQKTNEATPNQIWYDKQLTNGIIRIWPEPDDVQDYIKFTARFPIQDLTMTSETFEVSDEWYEAISWQLAIRLAPKYERPIDPTMGLMAQDMWDKALSFDSENTSSIISMGR